MKIWCVFGFHVIVVGFQDSRMISDFAWRMASLTTRPHRSSQTSSAVRDQLKAPDATISNDEACGKTYGDVACKVGHFTTWLTT